MSETNETKPEKTSQSKTTQSKTTQNKTTQSTTKKQSYVNQLFDATPLCTHIWDEKFNLLNCNEECVKLFETKDKEDFIANFHLFSPEFQPNGERSQDFAQAMIKKAFDEGKSEFDWMHCLRDGTPVPCHNIIKKVGVEGAFLAVAYVKDQREELSLIEELKHYNESSQKQFDIIWNKVDSAILIIDFDSHLIIDVNPAAINMYGGTFEEMVGKHCSVFFGVEICPITDLKNSVDKAERKFHCKDGTVLDVIKSVSVMEYQGKTALLESFADITAMKQSQSESQMLELSSRMKAMIDANPYVNVLYDSDNKVIDCNQAALDFWGFKSKEEFIRDFKAMIDATLLTNRQDGTKSESLDEQLAKTLEGGQTRHEVEMMVRGQKKHLITDKRKIPMGDSYVVVSYLFDMTEAVVREQEINKTKADIELQLTKLDLAVRAAKVGLWDMEVVGDDPTDPHNMFTWSDEFRHLLGFKDEKDFPNLLSSWSYRLHPDDHDRTLDLFAKHILDKTGQTRYDIEYRLLKKDDTFAYVRASGETIRDTDGNAKMIVGALLDITESKRLIVEAEKQKILADEANKAKSSFLSTMSHEIRTPMNAILGIAEIQIQKEEVPREIKSAFDKIRISGDMLLSIINDILDLSKIEAGKLELLKSNYEVASLLSDTSQLNMMRIGSKAVTFELYVDKNVPVMLYGDELRIKQIVNNLLSNAFKYTNTGVVSLHVRIEEGFTAMDKVLVLKIKDTGQGMTKEQVAHLFDEYSRFNAEANRTTEGTGLGMSITKNLVRLMDGRITVESVPGEGSIFTVFLPQGKVNNEVLSEEMIENLHLFRTTSISQLKRTQIRRDPMPYGKVLVVDDVESNIYVATGLMTPYDLEIDSACSGFEAIEKIKANQEFDVIFMDHMMPKMDGIEAVRIIRTLGYKKPIVALTANAVTGQAEIFLSNGFDDFISKPIDVRQLNIILNKFVRDAHPIEEVEAAREEANRKKAMGSNEDSSLLDPKFIEVFLRDAKKSMTILTDINNRGNYEGDDLRTYTIQTHGIKSALSNIGQMEASAFALRMEAASRENDIDLIKEKTGEFLEVLEKVIEELTPEEEKPDPTSEKASMDADEIKERLQRIREACDDFDESVIDKSVGELKKVINSTEGKELLYKIEEGTLHCDFDEVKQFVDELEKHI